MGDPESTMNGSSSPFSKRSVRINELPRPAPLYIVTGSGGVTVLDSASAPAHQTVTFTWRDYRQGGQVKPLTLSAREFLRRFRRHILPAGLGRIRHYGILGNHRRQREISRARTFLERHQKSTRKLAEPTPLEPMVCPLRIPMQADTCSN